jgi:hypothetical protein
MNTGLMFLKRSSHHRPLHMADGDEEELPDIGEMPLNDEQEHAPRQHKASKNKASKAKKVLPEKEPSRESSADGALQGSGNIDAAWDLETAYGPPSARSLATSEGDTNDWKSAVPSLLTVHSSSQRKVPLSPCSTGLIDRSNGFDADDEIDDSSQGDQDDEDEESLASFSEDVMRGKKKSTSRGFNLPDRAKSSDTLIHLFEKSLHAKPEHRSSSSSKIPPKDDGSRQNSDPTTTTASLSDSMTFDTAIFDDPNDTNNSSQDSSFQSPKKTSKSFNFVKSPFSSPATNNSAASLRHHLGNRPSITRQTSQRSTDTKSTIEGAASDEIERQRALLDPSRKEVRSSKLPIGQSPTNRKSVSSLGVNAPAAPPMIPDSPGTPLTSHTRKSAPNLALNPLNPAPEGGNWRVPDRDLNNLSNMLLVKSQSRRAMAEIGEGITSPSTPSQSRRSLIGKAVERHTSTSPSPRRGSRRNHRHLIPEYNLRSPDKHSQRPRSKSPHALVASTQRPRSKSPHSLAAASAAAGARRSARSPSIGRSNRYRTQTRSQSPPPVEAYEAPLKPPCTPPAPASPSSRSLQSQLTPEKIIEHIRAGNFNLEMDESTANFSAMSAPGRITLKINSIGNLSSMINKSQHSKLSNRSESPRNDSSLRGNGKYERQTSYGSLSNQVLENICSNHSRDLVDEAPPPPSSSPSKSPRRGRRKQVLEEEALIANAARSRSPSRSGHRRRSSDGNYHRSPSGLRDRTSTSTPTPEEDSSARRGRRKSEGNHHRSPSGLRDRTTNGTEENNSGRKGRRKTGSTTTSRDTEDRTRSSSRERTRDPSSPRKTTTRREQSKPSRDPRSRSRSREPRSRLRKRGSSQDHDDPFAGGGDDSSPIKVRPPVDTTTAPDVVPDTRRSSRNLKDSSSSSARRREERKSTKMRKASPSSSSRIDRPAVVSPSSAGRTQPRRSITAPSIKLVSPVVLSKEKATTRQPSPGSSRSERNLFSSNWAQDVNDDDWINKSNDENRRQPSKERSRKAQSSRHLF